MKRFFEFLLLSLLVGGIVCSQTVVSGIACGGNYSFVLNSDGTSWGWGYNGYGQLAVVTTNNVSIPVSSFAGMVAVANGASASHSLALKSDGTVWGCGYNAFGQLGNGVQGQNPIFNPVQAVGISQVVGIAVGQNHSLALKSNGTVWAWGSNGFGQLGNSVGSNSSIPVQATGLTGVVSIATGADHSLALRFDGTVWMWGSDSFSQFGSTPTQIVGLSEIVCISAGASHSIALKSDGIAWAWGRNDNGQLGNGNTGISSSVPTQVLGLTSVTAIAGGGVHSLALRSDGTVWAWGSNTVGQLGNGTTSANSTTPIPVGISNAVAIAGGYGHNLALKADSTVWAWGDNSTGQLGNGSFGGSYPTPAPVSSFSSPPAPVTVRVSFKRVHGAGSATPAFWTNQNVFQWLTEVNTLYAVWNTKIQFQMVGQVEDILDSQTPVSWYHVPNANAVSALEEEAEKYPCKYLWRTDAVNIYLVDTVGGMGGGYCSLPMIAPQKDIIVLTPSMLGESVGLAHELGHYLGLLHTHANHEPLQSGSCPSNSLMGINGTFGDFVGDTRNDSDPCAFFFSGPSNPDGHDNAFDALASAAGYTNVEKAAVRRNVMSYHGRLTALLPSFPQILLGYSQAKFTPGQIHRMWRSLAYRSRVIMGAQTPVLSSASPLNAVSPGPSLATFTGANLPVSGGTGAPQLAVRAEEQTSYFTSSSGTLASGAFSEPLAPGVHCMGLLVNGDLVAHLPQAITVWPSLELSTTPTLPEPTFAVTLTSSVPYAFVYLIVGVRAAQSIPAPWSEYPHLLIDISAPYQLFPLITDAQGLWQIIAPISGPNSLGLASGARLAVQAVEITTLYRLTNLIEVVGP